MKEHKTELINYRISRAKETFEDAKILANKERWNSVINRLYYAAFYAVSALLLYHDLKPTTHTGAKSNFSEFFIKPGIISKELGKNTHNFFHGGTKEIMLIFSILTEKNRNHILSLFPILLQPLKIS